MRNFCAAQHVYIYIFTYINNVHDQRGITIIITRKKLLIYIPRAGATTTPTKTTSFRILITMRWRRIKWILWLIWRYIWRCWLLLTAWSVTIENWWVFLIRVTCAHNLWKRIFFNYFLSISLFFLLLCGNNSYALLRLDRQYLLWAGKGCRQLKKSAPNRVVRMNDNSSDNVVLLILLMMYLIINLMFFYFS